MRTIQEIKSELLTTYSQDDNVRLAYGLVAGQELKLSKVSIENILFYAVAVAIYVFEGILDQHVKDVNTTIELDKPHTLNWYCSKVKEYQHGYTFNEDTMQWDNGTSTDDEVEQSKIVKFCAASEETIRVVLKVAGTGPNPLTTAQLSGLQSYMKRIKDAGVYLTFRNANADYLRVNVSIWYNPTIMNSNGENILTNEKEVQTCIKQFVENIPFNSELHVDKLEDAIQLVNGVEIVKINSVKSHNAIDTNPQFNEVNGYEVPYSGYYKFYQASDLSINYIPYNNDNNNTI